MITIALISFVILVCAAKVVITGIRESIGYKRRTKMLDEMKQATDRCAYHIERGDENAARAQLQRWDEINELYDIEWKKFNDQ